MVSFKWGSVGLHKVVRLRQQENHCVRFTVTEREKSTSASTTKTALRLRNSDVDCCSAKDSGKCTLSTRHPEHGSCVSRPVAPKEERRPSSNAEDAEDLSPCPVYLKQCNVNANPVLMCSPQPEKHSSQEFYYESICSDWTTPTQQFSVIFFCLKSSIKCEWQSHRRCELHLTKISQRNEHGQKYLFGM